MTEDKTRDNQADVASGLALTARLEAVLMAAERSLGDSRLAEAVSEAGEKIPSDQVREAIDELNAQYEQTGRVFRIIRVASGWRVMTIPEVAPVLRQLLVQRQQSRLTPATLETLSIIAYRQPVMRAEIEAIRGVACGDVLRGLLERRMIRIAGRAEELGRPILYGTTREFLKVFGLAGIDDLPEIEGLPRSPSHKPSSASEAEVKPVADEDSGSDAEDASSPDDQTDEASVEVETVDQSESS
ncbi:MAG: SMC-Scp complex subunit ScpB [Phycisphaerales bacterium]|nr:SMC-Scp complex subunit ScpB [Phycisphaerales bacterium]